MKQYQFKLSPDFKRITARELPDFKERYLRDPKLDRLTSEKSTLRFSKEIVVSNVADLKWRKSLLRLIGTRLRDAKRNQNTSEIERLQEMQTELRQAPAVPGADHPKVRAAIHRAIKTRRQAIKRKLDPKDQRLTVKKRIALLLRSGISRTSNRNCLVLYTNRQKFSLNIAGDFRLPMT